MSEDNDVFLESTKKQPYEEYYIEGNFEDNLAEAEEISGTPNVTAKDSSGSDASSDVLNGSSKIITNDKKGVLIQIKAGTAAKSPYKITFKIATNATPSNKFELDMLMYVKEK